MKKLLLAALLAAGSTAPAQALKLYMDATVVETEWDGPILVSEISYDYTCFLDIDEGFVLADTNLLYPACSNYSSACELVLDGNTMHVFMPSYGPLGSNVMSLTFQNDIHTLADIQPDLFESGGVFLYLLAPDHVGTEIIGTIHRVYAVPEPATWAMMIGGFALAGGALRRRRGMAARVQFA
ncbi:PEPxxWA-CTERM sorting domain-containing protein [Sphingobium lignivorans]|uniref:Ice-binding protein C-terminal domain-containing protein n=1 Tax=Sphingobium lignivorans TaxID=2735886 RepID=A0ABR6NBK7_9SPHN|nr:PEPxxWA-CTERM sorting domain-containing protein [Sphingobium lignivorans]MBB5984665.1 hypothetical protein [Sphingobium lignivorans]